MKRIIMLFVTIFGTIGAYIPILMGIDDDLGGWSILGGFIGGIIGIWLGVKIAK